MHAWLFGTLQFYIHSVVYSLSMAPSVCPVSSTLITTMITGSTKCCCIMTCVRWMEIAVSVNCVYIHEINKQ